METNLCIRWIQNQHYDIWVRSWTTLPTWQSHGEMLENEAIQLLLLCWSCWRKHCLTWNLFFRQNLRFPIKKMVLLNFKPRGMSSMLLVLASRHCHRVSLDQIIRGSRFGSIIGKSSSEGIKDLISPVPAVQLWEQRFKVTIQLQHSMRFGWPSKWKAWNRERTSDTAAYSGYWVTKARVPAGIPCRLNMKSTTPKNCAEQNQTSTTESETARDLRLLHRCLSRSGAAPNPTNQYSFPS